MKFKKFLSRLLVFVLLLIVLAISYKLWLVLPSRFLLVKDNLEKADCMVVLEGDAYFRIRKAVELYNEGYAQNIIIFPFWEGEKEFRAYYNLTYIIRQAKDMSPEEVALAAFKYFGKDSQGIHLPDFEITSTYDEAVGTKKFMLEKGFKSLILVTSTYHTRRALMIFKLVFEGTGIKIYNCTAKNELSHPQKWWQKERDVESVIQEYNKIIYNFFYHFVFRKERTSFDIR